MAIGDGVSALASLGVTFGGFSPTAMDGVAASKEYVEQLEKAEAKRKAAARRKREFELARTSKTKTYTDDQNISWSYVTIDEKFVRIERCYAQEQVLRIPASIEGLPVLALAPDALSRNDDVEEIICPDSIESIGSCAFRFCPNLRKVVFPAHVSEYSPTWISHCPNMKHLILPGELTEITLSVFDNAGIEILEIGSRVHTIEPGAFQKTRLHSIKVAQDNPFLYSDGDALYSIDGTVLLALTRPVARYEIKSGCKAIGKKAFYGIEAIKRLTVPEGIQVFGEFAFSHSGLETLTTPASLESIQAKAFYYCKSLRSIELNEGLTFIGDSAFEQSALEALHIPASIETIGSSITADSNVIHTGPQCSITIDEASELLFLDGEGGLYRHNDDGVHMIQLMYREAKEYTTWPGASVIDDYAFAYHQNIESVVVQDGVKYVGTSAFRCSSNLRHVTLPDSVVEIGADAFLDTSLEQFRVPASLEKIGKNALITKAARHGGELPSLSELQVAEGNEHFYVVSGMLCERMNAGSRLIVFASGDPYIVIPPEVVTIEEYAFNNARGIEYLEITPGIRTIGTGGLSVWCWIEHIHVQVSEPLEGRTSFDFYFPNTNKGIHSICLGIGGASWVNVPGIFTQYDNCIASAHDYNSPRNRDSISVYDQVKKIVSRLDDPILLTNTNRNLFDRILKWHITEICVDIARNDDRYLIDRLLDFGYINADNLEEIIAAVNKLQDAAMTGYLLEVKRRRYNLSAFDFDL